MTPVFRADFRPGRLASRTGAGRPCRPPCVGCSPAAAGRLLLEAEGHARGDVHVSAVGGSGPEAAVASERVVDAGADRRADEPLLTGFAGATALGSPTRFSDSRP